MAVELLETYCCYRNKKTVNFVNILILMDFKLRYNMPYNVQMNIQVAMLLFQWDLDLGVHFEDFCDSLLLHL